MRPDLAEERRPLMFPLPDPDLLVSLTSVEEGAKTKNFPGSHGELCPPTLGSGGWSAASQPPAALG